MSETTDEILLQENRNLQILQKSLSGALKDVFGEYTEAQRFLDLKRVPLLCKTIEMVIKNQDEEKKERADYIAKTAKILEDHRLELNLNLREIREKIENRDNQFVTKEALIAKVDLPIKLVYGTAGIILTAVIVALVYLVVQR